MMVLKKLFTPVRIGAMELRNRIAMSPMHTDFANPDGTISQRLIDYHEARAEGGVGLIITEVCTIGEFLPYANRTVGIWDDKFIPGFKSLVDAIHAHGTKIIPQISHPGPESLSPFFHKIKPVGPSAIMCYTTKQVCRELTIEEIKRILVLYGEAARRAREAGCDGVEVHCAHSYMLAASFLSPLRNRRTDEYGGTIDARLKFPSEAIESIKSRAGRDFPVVLRISGDELTPGGHTIHDAQYFAPILTEAGVDAFHVSAGSFPHAGWRILAPTGTPQGLNVPLAAALKQVVSVPVMAVGRINDPRVAERILEKDEADMVVMGRALLADPELPNKSRQGRFDDIAPCIACNLGCEHQFSRKDMTCVVNPTVGKEREMRITPASKPKKVMVIGGGPAGLETARVAALRGHKVDLYEKEWQVGGQFNLAAVPPMKQELTKVPKYLVTQARKAGASIHLNQEVTAELIQSVRPDVAIIATGGKPLIPKIPGIDGKKVATAHDLLAGKIPVPNGNVLVIGGGLVGLETAEFLAKLGDNQVIGRTHVTIVEMLDVVGKDMVPEHRTLLMRHLREMETRIITSAKVKEILADGAIVERDGKEEAIQGMDCIVIAIGAASLDVLSDKIEGKVPEVHVIGDARQPCRALEAIAEGSLVARRI